MMQINEKIRQARVSKGWTQEQIAEKLEESRSTYAEWERKTVPQADTLVKIAKVTGIPILEFIAAIDENVAHGRLRDEKSEKPDAITHQQDKIVFVEAKSLGASYERIIEEKEARRRDAEAFAKKMEDHYNDAKQDKEKLFETINSVLKPIKEKTEAIEANLSLGIHQLQEQIYVTSTSVVRTEEAVQKMNLSAVPKHVAPFAKKGKAISGPQQDGGKKDKAH